MSQITLLFLYAAAACAFAFSRLPQHARRERLLAAAGFALGLLAVLIHGRLLSAELMQPGLALSSAVSLIGLQLGLIALIGAFAATLRGLSAGLLLLAAMTGLATGFAGSVDQATPVDWQIRAHVLTSMFAYGLLTVGAIVAVSALIQERRLRNARLSAASHLFAPLVPTERLLYAITTAGFTVLALSVISGVTFVENLFAQHLVHKTTLSLLALLLFGILLLGRWLAGWRGRRAIYLYLAGFVFLCLAYFGSRYILEEILGRSWS